MLFARGLLAKHTFRNKCNQGKKKNKKPLFYRTLSLIDLKLLGEGKVLSSGETKAWDDHLVKIKLHLRAKKNKRNAVFLMKRIAFISFTLHSSSA